MSVKTLCQIDDIEEGKAKGFDIAGTTPVFAVRKDDQVYVYKNSCPHLGVELEWLEDQFLDPDGALIQCATHGALFIIESGECVSGPCLGDKLKAISYEVTDDGMLQVPEEALK